MQQETAWTPEIWRNFECVQQPTYLSKQEVDKQTSQLKSLPPLVNYCELEQLKEELKQVEAGNKFFLIMGDCAERFEDCTSSEIEAKAVLINKCSQIIEQATTKPVLQLYRLAGQYAKPRSADYETIDGQQYLSYRGDSVNDISKDNRKHEPERLLTTYYKSAATLNYLRACTPASQKIYAAHEGLLLEYESCLTREFDKKFYDLSGHFVWIGERTRNVQQGHVKFFAGLNNPVGVKVGGVKTEEEFLQLHKNLNPNNEKGKLVVITRCGVKKVAEIVPKLVEIKQKHQLNFVWVSDPMHGNTFAKNGYKTRDYAVLLEEIRLVKETLEKLGEKLGGIHLEATPNAVTECVGGGNTKVLEEDLGKCYTTYCDPRLNGEQTVELIKELVSAEKK